MINDPWDPIRAKVRQRLNPEEPDTDQ